MVGVADTYAFHFPSVTLCKGQALHKNMLLFFKYLAWFILDWILTFRETRKPVGLGHSWEHNVHTKWQLLLPTMQCTGNVYIWSFVASDSIVLIGVVDRHFTSAPAVQCPIEELCGVLWGPTAQTAAVEYVNHTGKQFWNNLIVFQLGVREASDVLCCLRTTCFTCLCPLSFCYHHNYSMPEHSVML